MKVSYMKSNMRASASSLWHNIFLQTWLHILTDKKTSTHCKHVPCNTSNEDLLSIKRKGDS